MSRVLLLLVLGLAGCASARPAPPSTVDAARRAFDGRTAQVTLADGTAWSGAALRIADDETSWIHEGDVFRTPTCAVASLRAEPLAGPRPGRFGRGVIGLGTTSALVGAMMGGSLGCGGLDSSPNAGCIAASAALLGAAGALVGLGLDAAAQPAAGRRQTVQLVPSCAASVPQRTAAE